MRTLGKTEKKMGTQKDKTANIKEKENGNGLGCEEGLVGSTRTALRHQILASRDRPGHVVTERRDTPETPWVCCHKRYADVEREGDRRPS